MKLVRIYECLDPIRGLLVRGLLESDGIDVLAKVRAQARTGWGP